MRYVFSSLGKKWKTIQYQPVLEELLPLTAASSTSFSPSCSTDATLPSSALDDGSVKGNVLVVSVPSSSSISGHSITIPSALLSNASFLLF
jgi:hypothetical protein